MRSTLETPRDVAVLQPSSLSRVTTFLRAVHLLSATVWVGGSVALVVVGVPAIRATQGEARAAAMRALGRRWRPLGWSSMGIAIVSGLWLSDRHGAFHSAALDTSFDRWLMVKSALVVLLVAGSLVHDFVLGPRLQREIRGEVPPGQSTRMRLIVVGWFSFVLTIAVPVLGVVVLSYLD
jgi:putative copper export protein